MSRPRAPEIHVPRAAVALALGVFAIASGCSTSSTTSSRNSPASTGQVRVVAAENSWGSIASQLGGDHAQVTSIIHNPETDPHDYEPTPADARTVASANYVIVNGVGYDPWMGKMLSANPSSKRVVLNVGDLVGVKAGGNPHRWYSPPDVAKVMAQITADYKRLDPHDSAFFDRQHSAFATTGMGRYNSLIADIKANYNGTPVGASESIFALMAPSLGLDLVTPSSFLTATTEGTDPSAADKSAADAQIKRHQINVYVFNTQNSTPDVQAQVRAAKAAGIPTTTITETLTPTGVSFQDWQAAQLQSLESALAQSIGK